MKTGMIVYDKIARHNFLCEELCKKLVDAGIDMSDASYYLIKVDGVTYVSPMPNIEITNNTIDCDPIPTYTLADMIYKMDEYPYRNGKSFGPLGFTKDAPFYSFHYHTSNEIDANVEGMSDTPIEAAAYFLIQSMKNGIDVNFEDVRGKYNG